MMTDETRKKCAEIRRKIEAAVQAAIPEMVTTHSGWDGNLDGKNICVEFSSPREYMGRFDAGKEHWTIDLKENVTYSRKKQVRVKVDGDKVSFDSAKLQAHVAALRKIIADDAAKKSAIKATESKLPPLPPCMNAEPTEDGRYMVRIIALLTLEQTTKLAAAVSVAELGL